MSTNILKHFGDQVRARRMEQGLSQEKLAVLAGVHRTYVGMIERAEKNVTLTSIEKFAKALKVKPSDLLD